MERRGMRKQRRKALTAKFTEFSRRSQRKSDYKQVLKQALVLSAILASPLRLKALQCGSHMDISQAPEKGCQPQKAQFSG